jgi:hypothetical protein
MAELTVDRVLHDLKIISALREGDKLCMADGALCVMHPSPFNLVWRWSRGESRVKTLDTLRTVLLDALAMAEYSIDRVIRRGSREAEAVTADYTAQSTVRRLYKGTQSSVLGLKYLRTTYAGDGHTTATIDVLRERVTERLDGISRWLAAEGLLDKEAFVLESFAGCILLSEADLRA